jgi:hypothetical protein
MQGANIIGILIVYRHYRYETANSTLYFFESKEKGPLQLGGGEARSGLKLNN